MGDNLKGIAQGAFGGVLAGGMLLGTYVLYCTIPNGIDGGDLLAFAGVIVGVALTASVSIGVDFWKRRSSHASATKAIRVAMDDWFKAVNNVTIDYDVRRFSRVREVHAFIGLLASELDRDARVARQAAHTFMVRAPELIARLETVPTEFAPETQTNAAIYWGSQLAGYGTALLDALDDQ